MKNNKKGSAIAEAAIIFPVVLIVLLIVMYILISLYIEASTSARDNMSLRKEAGLQTESVIREEGFAHVIPGDKFGRIPFQTDAEITEGQRYLEKILISDNGRVFIIDEVKFIRIIDLAKGVF